jgi:GNAT superfamily N-acetyltransferase
MVNIQVSQATLSNLDVVVPLFDAYRQFYGQPSDLFAAREFLRERFNHGESTIFLAFEENIPIGFSQLYPSFSSVSMARVFLLNDLFVSEQGRRKGVASQLIAAAIDYARTVSAIRLNLSTSVANSNAQAAYNATGWKRDVDFWHYNFVI